jgi:hypothetical protein
MSSNNASNSTVKSFHVAPSATSHTATTTETKLKVVKATKTPIKHTLPSSKDASNLTVVPTPPVALNMKNILTQTATDGYLSYFLRITMKGKLYTGTFHKEPQRAIDAREAFRKKIYSFDDKSWEVMSRDPKNETFRICFTKSLKYQVRINKKHIGTYANLSEAMKARNDYVLKNNVDKEFYEKKHQMKKDWGFVDLDIA